MRLPALLAALSALAVALPAPADTPAQLRDAFVLEAKAANPDFAGPSADRGRACTAQEKADVLAWLLAAR